MLYPALFKKKTNLVLTNTTLTYCLDTQYFDSRIYNKVGVSTKIRRHMSKWCSIPSRWNHLGLLKCGRPGLGHAGTGAKLHKNILYYKKFLHHHIYIHTYIYIYMYVCMYINYVTILILHTQHQICKVKTQVEISCDYQRSTYSNRNTWSRPQ